MRRLVGFSRNEAIALIIILTLILLFSIPNFMIAQRRSRDNQRKNDVRLISDSIKRFQAKFGFLPLSQDGKIAACNSYIDNKGIQKFYECRWAYDGLSDILVSLPSDPDSNHGISYYYLSNGKYFQLYASLEGLDEPENDSGITARALPCGVRVCNFGLSSDKTPLDKSIEEYENEIE